jgi:hypothetical protein
VTWAVLYAGQAQGRTATRPTFSHAGLMISRVPVTQALFRAANSDNFYERHKYSLCGNSSLFSYTPTTPTGKE